MGGSGSGWGVRVDDSKIQRFKIYSAFNPKHIGL